MAEVIIKGKKLIAGVSGIERIDGSKTEIGPYQFVNTTNRFVKYQQMCVTSPHVLISLIKLSLSIIKGFRIECNNESKKKEYEEWATRICLRSKIQMLVLLLCRDGTYIANITNPIKETFDFNPVLMEFASIYPIGYKPDAENATLVLQAPFDRIIINEGIQNAEDELKREDIIYGALFPYIGKIKDNRGRETYGLYGLSMLESIENVLCDYLDITRGYAQFIKRYGFGRLHINYKALEELIREGEVDEAIDALNKLSEEHELIEQNEDIIGAGFEIKELDTGGSNPNITQYKESLEKDIQIGLLQAPLTMGRAEGTTYASGYISEEERMITLEGIQNIVTEIVNNEIIRKREGAQPGQSIDVSIVFDELSKPKVDSKDLGDARDKGAISIEDWRSRSGFPEKRNPTHTYAVDINSKPPSMNPADNVAKPITDKTSITDSQRQDGQKDLNNNGVKE